MKTNKNIFKKEKMKGAEPIFIDKGSKVGVLMLHGFTSTPYQFKELANYLGQKGLTCYAPLIAGHGTSPENLKKTSPQDWQKSAKDAYFEIKKKAEKIIIIGNSFGGNLAFWLVKELKNEPLGIVSLGTPIFLKYQKIIKLRYFLYGWMKEYYKKPRRVYKLDYIDMADEITYPSIPMKSLMEFLQFLKEETIPFLGQIKSPTLIIHSNSDHVVNPKSAIYIHSHISSSYKRIFWFGDCHTVTNDEKRTQLFDKICGFIKEII